MKILYFCITKLYSGAEIYTMNLARAFKARGLEVTIVCLPNSPVSKKSREFGLEVMEVVFGSKLGKSTSINFLLNLRKRLRLMNDIFKIGESVDFVIFQFKGEQIMYSLLKNKIQPFQVLAIEHGPLPRIFQIMPFKKMLANFYKKCDRVYAVSSVTNDSIKRLHSKVQFLPPSANSNLLEVRSIWPKEKSVLFAGRLTKKKGIEEFVQTASRNPNILFYVAGSGNLACWVQNQAKLHINLIFVGVVEDISTVLSKSMAVAIFSRENGEGRPLIALEAIQAGRHVFVSEKCKVAELLKFEFPDYVTILQESDSKIFKEQITKLKNDGMSNNSIELPSWKKVSNIIIPENP